MKFFNFFMFILLLQNMHFLKSYEYFLDGMKMDFLHDNQEQSLLKENEKLIIELNSFSLSKYRKYLYFDNYFYIEETQDLIKQHILHKKVWESHIIEIFKYFVKPTNVVIDIGAYNGIHTIALSNIVGNLGTVWSFEPQLKLFSELVMNARLNNLNNIKFRRVALGSINEITSMEIPDKSNVGATSLGSGGCAVEMRTLDSYNISGVNFIKIDVEHTEYDVLLGAQKTIKESMPIIVIEIMGGYNLYRGSEKINDQINKTINLIKSFDYEIYHITNYLHEGHDYLAIPKFLQINLLCWRFDKL